MEDPSSQVAAPLLTHLHCLSKMPYPPFASLPVETVGELLLQAPEASRKQLFSWQMLNTPPDNSVFLVWVPPMLNGGCASDGYVWIDSDQGYSMELPKGYVSVVLLPYFFSFFSFLSLSSSIYFPVTLGYLNMLTLDLSPPVCFRGHKCPSTYPNQLVICTSLVPYPFESLHDTKHRPLSSNRWWKILGRF